MEKIKIWKGWALIALIALVSCTKYNYEDSGLSKGVHDCSMWDYMCRDSVNWYHTVAMIRHAGMEDIFKGEGDYRQITFFGITNIPILKYLETNNMKDITEMDPDFCRLVLKRLIVPGQRIMRDDVTRGNSYKTGKEEGNKENIVMKGGEDVNCIFGSVWLYSYQEAYNGVAEAGEVSLYIMSRNLDPQDPTRVVSTNIQTQTGVVQALSNTFKLTQI